MKILTNIVAMFLANLKFNLVKLMDVKLGS